MELPNQESFLFDSLATTLPKQVNNANNDDVPDYEDFDDDASLFTTASIDSASGRDIYGNPTLCPGAEDDELDVHLDSENRQNLPLITTLLHRHDMEQQAATLKKHNNHPPWGVGISKRTSSSSSAPTLVTQMQLLSKIYMLQRLKLRRKKFKRGKRMSSGNSHLRGALERSLNMDTFGAVLLGND